MHLINNTLLRWLTVFNVQFNADKPLSIVAVAFMEKLYYGKFAGFISILSSYFCGSDFNSFQIFVEQSK